MPAGTIKILEDKPMPETIEEMLNYQSIETVRAGAKSQMRQMGELILHWRDEARKKEDEGDFDCAQMFHNWVHAGEMMMIHFRAFYDVHLKKEA